MAGGGFGDDKGGARAHLYEYRITGYFVFACVVAAMGGSLFGYDLGVSGEYIFFLNTLFFSSQILSAYVYTIFYKCLVWVIQATCAIVLFQSLLPSTPFLCVLCFSPFPLNSEEELVVDQRKVWGKNIHKQKWVKKKDKVIFSYNNMR